MTRVVDTHSNNEIDQSIRYNKIVLKKNPNNYFANCNLAYCYLVKKKFSESIKFYRIGIRINPNGIEAINGLASAYLVSGNNIDGINLFHRALKINNKIIQTLYNLAVFYFENKKYYLSLKYFFKIHAIDPKNLSFYSGVYKVYYELNKYSALLYYLKKGIRLHGQKNLFLYFLYLNSYPRIYFSEHDRKRVVKRFEIILNYIYNYRNFFLVSSDDIYQIFSSVTNFHLAYCGHVPLNLLIKYYNLISFFTTKVCIEKSKDNIIKKKIVIISSFLYNHTVTRLYFKFFEKLNIDYELSFISLSDKNDDLTKKIIKNSSDFRVITNLRESVLFLQKNDFGIIFYPEIGMCPKTQFLASLRLAPIQMCGWGHPLSSGSSKIDYFISSDLMEPEPKKFSNENYKEKLIKIKNLGIDFSNKIFVKSYFKKNYEERRGNFIVIQSLFKIFPEDIKTYLNIIDENNCASITFIRDRSDHISNKFIKFLEEKFKSYFKNYKKPFSFRDKFQFIDRLSRKNFIENIKNYDVVLDTFSWSGGNTHLEALLCGVPVVTLPGDSMRSRHTYALLKKIKLNNLIAKDRNDYCEILKNLINDNNFYKLSVENINKNNYLLYENEAYIDFNKFLKTNIYQ